MLAGGGLPSPDLWLALTVLMSAASVLASRWRWRFPGLMAGLMAVLVLTQVVFHLACTRPEGAAHSGMAHSTAMHGMTGRQTVEPPGPDVEMIVLHLLAAVTLAAVLRFGEDVLRSTIDVLSLRLARAVRVGLARVPVVTGLFGFPSGTNWNPFEPAQVCLGRGPPR